MKTGPDPGRSGPEWLEIDSEPNNLQGQLKVIEE